MVLMVSGCSGASVEDLLSPPRLDGEQTEIYAALRAFTNDSITLKYPRSGQYRSAFVIKDIDDEPTDEAIVFYEMPNVSSGTSLRMNFLDKQDGKWVSVYDLAASGSEVESILFTDFGDGAVTILVNYLVQSSSDRSTSVMTYKDGIPSELVSIRNIYTDIFDADGNGTDDLFAISTERALGITSASIYGRNRDKFTLIGATNLNSGFAEIRKVTCGTCSASGTRGIFIDYASSDGSYSTDAIVYNDRNFLLSPAVTPASIVRSSNSYTPYIDCRDPDNDGCIEIPVTVPFMQYEDSPHSEQLCETVWYTLNRNGTEISRKFGSFVGTKGDYILLFPAVWSGKVTASASISEGIIKFNRYNSISGITEDSLLKLYGAPEGGSERYENSDEYIPLGTSSSTGWSYYAQLGTGPLVPTEAELKQMFRLQ